MENLLKSLACQPGPVFDRPQQHPHVDEVERVLGEGPVFLQIIHLEHEIGRNAIIERGESSVLACNTSIERSSEVLVVAAS